MRQKVKWGMIGLGDIANSFAQAFESEKAELAAVGSRTLDKAQSFADKYNIPKAYGSYEELYADEEIDVVYLATPNSYHAENMKDILNAGKHVLCEKAITMNKKELDEVLALADEKDLIVAEAMTIYHMPLYKKIKQRIDSGEFGELKLATSYFGSLKEDDPKNRFFNPELGGGALLDIGVYALSFVQFFLDADPKEFKTIVEFFETGVDEMSTISYSTTEGTLGNVTLSFRGKLPKQGVVTCEDAYITFMDYPRADEAVITYPDGETEVVKAGSSKEALKYEMENISEMILTGEDLSEIENTQRVNALMDKAAEEWKMDWIFE
ncbi:MAG TPA: Gfo/Idh/MocA family oxidoreductase [Atopostipes sp.]|nr:Gfo/Idh/MocA family oxidoreductase [Atopostipes sp.]